MVSRYLAEQEVAAASEQFPVSEYAGSSALAGPLVDFKSSRESLLFR